MRRSTALRLAALAMVMAATSGLVFGYLGWLHPAFDSFSHFRIHLAVVLALCALPLLLLRFRPEALFALALGATSALHTTGLPFVSGPTYASSQPTDTQGAGGVYRLLHINLRYDNATPEAALSLIGALRPDIVTLNEVSDMWAERLVPLQATYPYHVVCKRPIHVGGVAIFSRRPFADRSPSYCGQRSDFAQARLDLGGRTLDVATLHLGWPWPFEQRWQVHALERDLGRVGDTAVVAADLNAVPWSNSARRIEKAAGARLLRGIGPTWLDRRLPDWLRRTAGLPIDNAMVKGGVLPLSARTTEGVGSDHLPVLLEFILLPQERAPSVLQAAL